MGPGKHTSDSGSMNANYNCLTYAIFIDRPPVYSVAYLGYGRYGTCPGHHSKGGATEPFLLKPNKRSSDSEKRTFFRCMICL